MVLTLYVLYLTYHWWVQFYRLSLFPAYSVWKVGTVLSPMEKWTRPTLSLLFWLSCTLLSSTLLLLLDLPPWQVKVPPDFRALFLHGFFVNMFPSYKYIMRRRAEMCMIASKGNCPGLMVLRSSLFSVVNSHVSNQHCWPVDLATVYREK